MAIKIDQKIVGYRVVNGNIVTDSDGRSVALEKTATEVEQSGYPESAKLCHKCLTKTMIMLDGCLTCLSCGESKCS